MTMWNEGCTFNSEPTQDSYVDGPVLSQEMKDQFSAFTYNRPGAVLGGAGGRKDLSLLFSTT